MSDRLTNDPARSYPIRFPALAAKPDGSGDETIFVVRKELDASGVERLYDERGRLFLRDPSRTLRLVLADEQPAPREEEGERVMGAGYVEPPSAPTDILEPPSLEEAGA